MRRTSPKVKTMSLQASEESEDHATGVKEQVLRDSAPEFVTIVWAS